MTSWLFAGRVLWRVCVLLAEHEVGPVDLATFYQSVSDVVGVVLKDEGVGH